MERKLFYAVDKNGNKVLIDSLREKEGDFFCPFCKKKVVPKMGEKKVWHFAHIGGECVSSGYEEGMNRSLGDYKVNKIDVSDIPFETDKFTCKLCGTASMKENGVKLAAGFICKECYKNRDVSEIRELM